MKPRPILLAFVVLFVSLSCSRLMAQISTAEAQLNGSVHDQTGGMIPKASLSLRNVDTNQLYRSISGATGFYILGNIPSRHYELTVEAPGPTTESSINKEGSSLSR